MSDPVRLADVDAALAGSAPLPRDNGALVFDEPWQGRALGMAVALRLLGRRLWCVLGDWLPWTLDAWSSHTSQHFLDPYTFTHILHGIGFLWISGWVLPRLEIGRAHV